MKLVEAAAAGDEGAVATSLAAASEGERVAALYAAAGAGHLGVLEVLLTQGKISRLWVMRALVPAVIGEHLPCMERLLAAGAEIDRELKGRTAEGEAAAKGSVALLEALTWREAGGKRYQKKLDWDSSGPSDLPPEDEALPAAGDGYSALLNAIRGGHLNAVAFLVEGGADVNRITLAGRNPVEMAEALGHAEVAEFLRSKGAVPLDREALHVVSAARFGFTDLVLRKLPEVEDEAVRARAFQFAAFSGHVDLLHLLSDYATPKAVQDALGMAAAAGHTLAVRALLSMGAKVDAYDKPIGRTPLIWAAARNRIATMQVLVAAGAKLDKGSKGDRVPPLHAAIEGGHVEAVAWLLRRGAKANMIEADGTTTMQAAQESAAAAELVPLLEAAGGRADAKKSLLKELKTKLKKEKRKAFLPTVERSKGPPTGNRFGGQPCATGARPEGREGLLPLVVQVDLSSHPDKKAVQEGLLQLFWDPSARAGQAQIVAAGDELDWRGPAFPAQEIVAWGRAKSDFPSLAEDPARSAGALSDDESAVLRDLNLGGDKLGGWPDWLQDPVYPSCPTCSEAMTQLVLQIEAGRHVAIDLGDAGVGYVVQCPTHREQVAFFSQCY